MKFLLTVALVQCLSHCTYAAQDASNALQDLTALVRETARPKRLPDCVMAVILGMCYGGDDPDLDVLMSASPNIERVVRNNKRQFKKANFWTEFDEYGKVCNIELTDAAGFGKYNCATGTEMQSGYSVTCRALRWSPREGRASATIRVDNFGGGVSIGVINDNYATIDNGANSTGRYGYYNGWGHQCGEHVEWVHGMGFSWNAWCYDGSTGHIRHNNENYESLLLPRLESGDIVRVILDNSNLTFNVRGKTVTITLPEHRNCDVRNGTGKNDAGDECWRINCNAQFVSSCGNISLGVSLYGDYDDGGAKVTLLP